jgi:hypothetical protein
VIIQPRRWADLPDGALIVGPSGRIWQIVTRPAFGVSRLRCPETGETRDVTAPPADSTHAILPSAPTSDEQRALTVLSKFFILERLPS